MRWVSCRRAVNAFLVTNCSVRVFRLSGCVGERGNSEAVVVAEWPVGDCNAGGNGQAVAPDSFRLRRSSSRICKGHWFCPFAGKARPHSDYSATVADNVASAEIEYPGTGWTIICVVPTARGRKSAEAEAFPPKMVTLEGIVPIEGSLLTSDTSRDNPPANDCEERKAFVSGSRTAVITNACCGGPFSLARSGNPNPNGPAITTVEGASFTVAVLEANPGALAV
jgi:hypothetical protein